MLPGSGREVFGLVWPQTPPAPTPRAAQLLLVVSGQALLLEGLKYQDTSLAQDRTLTQFHVQVPSEAEHQLQDEKQQ